MKTSSFTPRSALPLVLFTLALAGAGLSRRLWAGGDDPPPRAASARVDRSVGAPPAPADSWGLTRKPKITPAAVGALFAAAADAATAEKASDAWQERAQFFAEERRVMARTWGLTSAQAAEFDIAVNDFHHERQAVFDRLTEEQITPAEVEEALRAVEERATARLLEVLGPERLLEYRLTAGHFVEAGLEHQPFVLPSPVTDSAPPTAPDAAEDPVPPG